MFSNLTIVEITNKSENVSACENTMSDFIISSHCPVGVAHIGHFIIECLFNDNWETVKNKHYWRMNGGIGVSPLT